MASLYRRKLANGKYAKEWYLNWVDAKGERHRDPLGRIDAPTAKAILAKKKLELINNPAGIVPCETLNDFSKEYLRWYSIQWPSSYDRVSRIFKCHLLPEFGDLPLNLITRNVAIEWRNDRAEEAASETVNKELKTLKAALERAVEWEKLPANPLSKKEASFRGRKDTLYLPKRKSAPPKFLSPEQLACLYRGSTTPRNAAIWKFLANTGLRRAEFLNLRVSELHEDRVLVLSTEEDPTKGRQFRTVPLNAAAQEAREVLLKFAGEDYVCPRMTLRSLSRCYKNDAARGKDAEGNPAPVPYSIHALRHTFCSQLVMASVHLRTVQLLAGHADIQTTMIYAHLAPDYLSNSVSKIAL